MKIIENENTIKNQRLDELKQAELIKQASQIEYVAMMCDVELPQDQEASVQYFSGNNHKVN